MDELNLNLILAALLNFFAVAFAFANQPSEETSEETKNTIEKPAPRPEPSTGQMMLSKWGHVG